MEMTLPQVDGEDITFNTADVLSYDPDTEIMLLSYTWFVVDWSRCDGEQLTMLDQIRCCD